MNHRCPECGALVEEDASFCFVCTAQIFRSRDEATIASTREKVIALTLFIVFGAGGGIVGGSALLIAFFDTKLLYPALTWGLGFGGVITFFVTLWLLLRAFRTV